MMKPRKTRIPIIRTPGGKTGGSIKKSHLWMILYSVIIAGSFPVAAAITSGVDSFVLTFWRFLSATLIFALMMPFSAGWRIPGLLDLKRYAIVGISYGLFFILMFQALKETTPLNTSTIYTMLPLLVMLLGTLVGEPLRMRQLAVLALSMAAALWVIFRGDIQNLVKLKISSGDVLFFAGTVSLAVYVIAMKKLQADESKIGFTFFSLLFATGALFAASLISAGSLPVPEARVWLGIAYLAGPSTACTFWILQYTAPRLGPNRVAAYTFLTPSAVVCLEWGLGLSAPQAWVLPGIGITLAAVWLLQLDTISGEH